LMSYISTFAMGHNFNSRSGHYTSGAGSWADQWNTITSAPTVGRLILVEHPEGSQWQHLARAASGTCKSATSQTYLNSQAAQFGMLQPSPPLRYIVPVPYPQLQKQSNVVLHQPMGDRGTPPIVARPLSHYEQPVGPYHNTIDTLAGLDPAILQLASDQLPVVSEGEDMSSWETFQDPTQRSTLSYAEIARLSSQAVPNYPYQPVNRMPAYTNANAMTMPGPTCWQQDTVTRQTPVRLSMHWQPQVIPPPATRHAARHKHRATYTPPTQADAPPWSSTPGGRAPPRRPVPMTRSGSKAESSTTSGRRSKRHTMSTVSEHMCCMCDASFESLTSKA